MTSPDGGITLASATHTVQSTAVSGAGLVLSIGALLFLVVWWARHCHKTRRSRKLVDVAELDAPPAHLRRRRSPPPRRGRSDERRVGKEFVRTCRSRWAPDPEKNNTQR